MYWFASSKVVFTMAFRIGVPASMSSFFSAGKSWLFTKSSSLSPVSAVPFPSSTAQFRQRSGSGMMDR